MQMGALANQSKTSSCFVSTIQSRLLRMTDLQIQGTCSTQLLRDETSKRRTTKVQSGGKPWQHWVGELKRKIVRCHHLLIRDRRLSAQSPMGFEVNERL